MSAQERKLSHQNTGSHNSKKSPELHKVFNMVSTYPKNIQRNSQQKTQRWELVFLNSKLKVAWYR